MGDCKKITNTAKAMVVNVRDGSKTAVSTFKEISANLKTVSLATEVPLKCFEVELKGFGEGYVSDPSLFVYNGDNTQTLEVFSKLLGKPIAELSSATEVLRINAAKVFTDLQTASDNLLLVVDWVRKIDDSPQSQFANKDILSVSLAKSLLEQEFVTDTVAKSFATSFLDSNIATDMVATTVQTPKQDSFAASDSVTLLVDFRPLIQDWVYSTDDVLGNANIDDDQYMLFNKVTIDSSILVDAVIISTSRALNDNIASIDAIVKSTGVSLTDSVGLPDVLVKSLAASKTDAAGTSDACTANLQNYMSALYVDAGYVGINYTL